jgi:hypothetical protein
MNITEGKREGQGTEEKLELKKNKKSCNFVFQSLAAFLFAF